MKDATGESVSGRVAGSPVGTAALKTAELVGAGLDPAAKTHTAEFGASGKIINFYGFLKAYVESSDDLAAERDDQERRLPSLAENDPLRTLRLGALEHATRPPARYTEASLIKELEDREIGRPSTYA